MISDSDESQSQEAIEQILKILSQQEEESLKNNQQFKERNEEDEYDW